MSRPSAWFHTCSGCNKTKRPEHCWADTEESHWCCPHGCLNFGSPASTALWGHEWAAVAWMASAEYEGFRALESETAASKEGGWVPSRKMWRDWIDDYLEGGEVWP